MKILHVTPHLGGGIGTVITGVCIHDCKNEHSILCLEETQTKTAINRCLEHNIKIEMLQNVNATELIASFDIIQIEWWHHPLTIWFLINYLECNKVRLVVWSHISGCNYPIIPYRFAKMPDAFVFATPYSFDNPWWSEKERETLKTDCFLAVSSGNDFRPAPMDKKLHEGFRVGYIGFLGYEKTHTDFVKICETCAHLEQIAFIIVGDLKYAQKLMADINASSVKQKFILKGYSENVMEELAGFDLFACLLQPNHTGASENALLEAMYSKTCPVVLKQCTERYLVQHNKTGMICDGATEFGRAICELYNNKEKRLYLAQQASEYVRTHYSIEHTIESLERVYQAVIKREKSLHPIQSVFGQTPVEWFLSCYRGNVKQITGLAAGPNKGSIYQYYRYFNDPGLEKLIEENE